MHLFYKAIGSKARHDKKMPEILPAPFRLRRYCANAVIISKSSVRDEPSPLTYASVRL